MSNNRSNETIAAEAITQYWLDEEKRDDTDPFIAKSSEQHDKEMGAAVIEALTAAGRLAGAERAAAEKAWSKGHAAGRDYQGDGWNSDAHDPEEDNPYRAAALGLTEGSE